MIQEFDILTEIDMIRFFKELESLSFYNLFDQVKKFKVQGDKLKVYFKVELDQDQYNELNDLVTNHQSECVDHCKAKKYVEIDTRTEELISFGYTYQEKQFSLSANAQTNILALFSTRNEPEFSYPVRYNTIDDTDYYDITDATDLKNMYLTALATKKGHVDSGTALKDQVRAATTEEEIEAITDNR